MKGIDKQVQTNKKCASSAEARDLFQVAAKRLFDINHWKEYSGKGSATFVLTDPSGNEKSGPLAVGDYIRIELPAPRNKSGYDWVRIQEIRDLKNEQADKESVSLTVAPSHDPRDAAGDTAHFFSNESRSTFVVERLLTEVFASEAGENEAPNVEAAKPMDKVRNAVVAVAAILGLSNIQWKKLMKGLLAEGDK